MSTKHALLSPSSASRWLECTPSAQLEADRPDKAGEAADEGTLAHKLADVMIEYELKRITKAAYLSKIKAIKKNKHYNDAMWEYCENYKTYVMEVFAEAQARCADAVIVTEQSVDLTRWIPEGFGTRDIMIIAAPIIDVIDLKYGKGVLVDAEENKQMMLYSVGSLDEYEAVFDIDVVRMTIYQPRIDNYSTWEISAVALREWADGELTVKAQLAWAGEGDFKPGKHCQFCKIKTTCRANADYHMELAQLEFAPSAELSLEELVDIFKRAPMFKNWINAVEADMLQRALKEEKFPGLKLVAGKSNRVITDKEKVKELLSRGHKADDYLSPRELLALGKLEKNIGKVEFNNIAGDYVMKPDGKPALVDESDKRAEYHSHSAADAEFSDDEDLVE